MTTSIIYKNMKKIEKKLNGEIGFNWWKRYIAAAVWGNISTPINLAITLLTAVVTGQSATENLISKDANLNITIITLIFSTLNTFFQPHNKMAVNLDLLSKYNDFGNTFEEIYYMPSNNEKDYNKKFELYWKLMIDVNKFQTSESPSTRNYFTDFIHFISRYTCLKNKEKWLDLDKEFIKSQEDSKSHEEAIYEENSQ